MASDWDERFRAGDHAASGPDPFFDSCKPFFHGGKALDLACGAGRHAVELARLGFQTAAVDFSAEALRLTGERAASQGLAVETRQLDLESDPPPDLGESVYDLAAVFQFLHRPLFEAIRRVVRPGGLVLYKTYTLDQLAQEGGPRNASFLLEPNELLVRFRDWRVLRYEEEIDGRATAALLAQKPA